MKNNKKPMFTVIAVFTLMLVAIGTTYAFFNYTRTGIANTIRVGRIAFVTRQTDTINLSNAFPIDPTETGIMNDSTKVGTLTIEIEGDADYSGGVEYLVSSVNSNIYTSTGKLIPVSLNVTVNSDLGTSDTNYFVNRDTTSTSIYKRIVGDTLVGDQMLLVGYIAPNNPAGTAVGIDGSITIKAYLDENKILISDTYDGTESDNMGTTNSMANGKTVLTTSEWNALQQNGLSFKVKVEANEGIWVKGSLEEIMKVQNLNTTTHQPIRDDQPSTYVTGAKGIDFGAISSDTNGKGVYLRAGTQNDDYPIYYYRGAVTDNNVIFNNKCWKAVRTTDTGGVKLIYNGEPGLVYSNNMNNITSEQLIEHTNTSGFIYDNTDYSWNATLETGDLQEFSFYLPNGGNYTFTVTGTVTQNGGGSIRFYKNDSYVEGGNGTGGGGGAALSYTHTEKVLNNSDKMKFTTQFGGSSSSSPTTIKIKIVGQDILTTNGCGSTGQDTQITLNESGTNKNTFQFSGKDLVSGNYLYKSPAYVGYMRGENVYEYKTEPGPTSGTYWSDVDYSGGVYTLKAGGTTSGSIDGNHHYVCDNNDCTKVRYYYEVASGTNYYIELENGKTVEGALADMQENTVNSNAKDKIDAWYLANMTGSTVKLEDTIWCNDRSMGVGNNNGWIANGGDIGTPLYYGAHQRSGYSSNNATKNQPSLGCVNKNDAFTVNNQKGNKKLTYPVALLTEDEIVLAGGSAAQSNGTYYLKTDSIFVSLSPSSFNRTSSREFFVGNFGALANTGFVQDLYGLRPAVSLKPGMPVISGAGTILEPYRIG